MNGFLEGAGAAIVVAIAYLAFTTWIVAGTVRRALGVQVGWVRTLVVVFATNWAVIPLSESLLGTKQALAAMSSDPTGFLAVLLLVTLWAFALSALVLVVLEIMVPTGSLPPLRSAFLGWGDRLRRGRRYTQIMAIVAKNGLTAQFRGSRRFDDADPEETSRSAAALRRTLDESGVTFVKLGQMLSTRADVMPPAYVRELAKLQNSALPVPWDAVRQVIEAELGAGIETAFAWVDEQPLATASVAQVHAARLTDGRSVVVKVQRPNANAQVRLDLQILLRIARTLEKNAPWARRFGVLALAQGFAHSLREELDYRTEVDNMLSLAASLDERDVRVPRVDREHSTARMIVMERFDGVSVARARDLLAAWPAARRADVAQRLLGAVLGQIVGTGVFHADLHGGNVVVWEDGRVGLLDFGSVGRLDAVSRRQLGMLLWAIDADDPLTATDAMLSLLDRPESLNERALQRAIGQLMTRFRGGTGSAGSLGVFSELFDLVVAHGFGVPPSIAAAMRSIGALEGTLTQIDPDLDLVEAARATGREAMGPVTRERIQDEFTAQLRRLIPLMEHLPRRIDKITEDLESGRFSAHVRVVSHDDDRRFLSGLVQQVVVAILAGFAALGGVVLASIPDSPVLFGGVTVNAFLGALLVFGGFMLALRSIALVFWRGR